MPTLRKIIYENDYADREGLRAALNESLDEFLQTFIQLEQETHKSVDGDDMDKLYDIITALIVLKWQQDYDNSFPVDFALCDNTRHIMRVTYVPHKWQVDDISRLTGQIKTLASDEQRGTYHLTGGW